MVALGRDPANDPGGVVARALGDERSLLARRVAAALVARHGRQEVGAAVARLLRGAGHGGQDGQGAIAEEALEVALGRRAAMAVVGLLAPGLSPHARAERLSGGSAEPARTSKEWLLELAEDRDGRWRSPWLRACVVRAARLGGFAREIDRTALAAAREPIVAEELALISG